MEISERVVLPNQRKTKQAIKIINPNMLVL